MAGFSVRLGCVGLFLSCALSAAPINLLQNPSFESDVVNPPASQQANFLNGSSWQVFNAINGWGLGYPFYGVELQRNNLYGVPSNSASGNNAWDGVQWAELDFRLAMLSLGQTATPQIYQDISTVSGATYVLSFYYAPRPDGGDQQLGVFWGNTSAVTPALIQTTSVASGTNSLTWTKYSFDVTATSTSMRIGFGSLQNLVTAVNGIVTGAAGNLIDLVSVTLSDGTGSTGTGAPGTTGTTGTPGTTGTTGTPGTTGPDTSIPEPGTYGLLTAGLLAIYAIRKPSV